MADEKDGIQERNPIKKLAELLQEAGAIPVIDGVHFYENHVTMSRCRFQELTDELCAALSALEEATRARDREQKLLNWEIVYLDSADSCRIGETPGDCAIRLMSDRRRLLLNQEKAVEILKQIDNGFGYISNAKNEAIEILERKNG